ncbi:hypothetical protein QFZ70_000411 [Arthrobacter sp. V1I9]|nr:hypothetical protein [Arthrobacter sp. V1I9]
MVRGLADLGAEGILLAGAGRAILLQLADPAVGRGVAEHSTFTDRPINRLTGTLTYVYAVVYGSDEQLKEVRRRVNRAHVPVRGAANENSAGYNAYNADLQLWVTATLYDTALTITEKIYGPLDDDAADAMYRDYAKLGTALQLPERMWPEDRAAFRRYWDERIRTLRADENAVRVGRGPPLPEARRALVPRHHAVRQVPHRGSPSPPVAQRLRPALERPPRAPLRPHHEGPGCYLPEAAAAHPALVQELLPEPAGNFTPPGSHCVVPA